jgi:protein SCO1/2
MFFGFTYCPEVCPTTLAQITNWLADMGPDANRLNVVFVTIDPERDTPGQLKRYLSSFDQRIRGLTGTSKAIDQMAAEYRVYVHKQPLPGGSYTMDHSATIYLFDREGRFVGPLVYTQPSAVAVPVLKRLVKSV